jgi:hypothetical protein
VITENYLRRHPLNVHIDLFRTDYAYGRFTPAADPDCKITDDLYRGQSTTRRGRTAANLADEASRPIVDIQYRSRGLPNRLRRSKTATAS